MGTSDRFTAEQRELWEAGRFDEPMAPTPGQTPEQQINLGIATFRYWCALEGVDPPPEDEIRAQLRRLRFRVL